MISAIYEGAVRHRRFRPVSHEFTYRMFMMYLDLAEIPALFDDYWLWSARRAAPAWLRRADHLGDPERPLDDSIRGIVEQRTGTRPDGPIRLLTHLRYFGFVMNPVSFYYCFDRQDTSVDTIIADITNTPWNERHAYVLHQDRATEPAAGSEQGLRFAFDKEFHVSPFMAMDHEYEWRFMTPGRRLGVHMENWQQGERVFDATMTMTAVPIRSSTLASALARYPFMTARVALGIYWQALRLRLKRAPFFRHPARRAT